MLSLVVALRSLRRFDAHRLFTRPLWLRPTKLVPFRCPHSDSTLDSNMCSRKDRAMSALLDLHPDSTHPVLAGIEEIEGALDRMLVGPTMVLETGDYATAVTALERVSRRLDAVKLKMVAAADHAKVAQDAGFTNTGAWVAKTTTVSRSDAARQVALAAELDSGHDATAEALDAGLVSPGARGGDRATPPANYPRGVTAEQRQVVEAHLVEKAAPVQPRPAPPPRPTSDRGRRTRPDRGRRPRERAHPHRRTSRPGQVLPHAARQRRRHHHRTLHRPGTGCGDARPRSSTR